MNESRRFELHLARTSKESRLGFFAKMSLWGNFSMEDAFTQPNFDTGHYNDNEH